MGKSPIKGGGWRGGGNPGEAVHQGERDETSSGVIAIAEAQRDQKAKIQYCETEVSLDGAISRVRLWGMKKGVEKSPEDQPTEGVGKGDGGVFVPGKEGGCRSGEFFLNRAR